jgi:hypothetical protein
MNEEQLKNVTEGRGLMIETACEKFIEGATAIVAAIKEMEQPTQPDQPAPLPDGYRLATEWERKNLPHPRGVTVMSCSPLPGAAWCRSNDNRTWHYCSIPFAVPFPPRPTQEWLDRHHVEIVGDWPTNEFKDGELWASFVVVDGLTFSEPLPFGIHEPHKGTFNGYRYKLRYRKPLLKDHNPPTFAELAKEEKLELCAAMVDDPASVVFQVEKGYWKRVGAPNSVALWLDSVYALASRFDLTDSGVDEK